MSRQAANGQAPLLPGPGPPLLHCWCKAAWLDDGEGREAHRVVFGHPPRLPESRELKGDAIRPPGETPG